MCFFYCLDGLSFEGARVTYWALNACWAGWVAIKVWWTLLLGLGWVVII